MSCCGCMSSNRKMLRIKTEKERVCFLQIIEDIPMPVPEDFSIYLCWECTASLVRFSKFKDQPVEATDYSVEVVKLEKQEEDFDADVKHENDYYSNDDEKPLIEICKKRKKKKVINGHIKINNKDLEYIEIELSADELLEERRNLVGQDDYINAMFKCEKCISSFPNADDLSDHKKMKHEKNASLFKCKICECSFGSEVSYNYHLKRHMRRYQCVVCSDRFTSKRSAVKHYNLSHCLGTDISFDLDKAQNDLSAVAIEDSEDHSNNKTTTNFPCEFCSKTFIWRTSLRKHMEMHRIENGQKRRPYCEPCKYCTC